MATKHFLTSSPVPSSTKVPADAEEEDILHQMMCPAFSAVLVVELVSVCALLALGLMALLELSQYATLAVGVWTWSLVGLIAPMTLLRPLAWNYLVSTRMDAMFPGSGEIVRWRLKREIADALLRDFLLQVISLACVFSFFVQRTSDQIHQFNQHRFDLNLTIDVRLFCEWYSCMSFLVFAMMSNVVSFHRLFYLQIGLTRKLKRALQEL